MEKLARYNQKLLAIIGTTVIVVAGLALIIGLGGLIISSIDFNGADNNGVNVNDRKNDNRDEIVRTQEITFDTPIQLDTTQAKYIIPVGQVNLEKAERVSYESGGKFSSYDYQYESYYGVFNNFIYYDHSRKLTKKIFDSRVAITHWAFLKKDTIEVLLFKGTNTDDNADNQMDSEDYQSLFVYFISDQKLLTYDFDRQTALNFEPMHKTEFVTVQVGTDKDKDFVFEGDEEPKEILALNLTTRKLDALISTELKSEIQKIIDGIEE